MTQPIANPAARVWPPGELELGWKRRTAWVAAVLHAPRSDRIGAATGARTGRPAASVGAAGLRTKKPYVRGRAPSGRACAFLAPFPARSQMTCRRGPAVLTAARDPCGAFPESDARPEALRVAKEESIVTGMAGRYAQALFALAQESHATDAVAADLQSFQGLVAESRDLERLVKSPVFSAEAQVKALTAILARRGNRRARRQFHQARCGQTPPVRHRRHDLPASTG